MQCLDRLDLRSEDVYVARLVNLESSDNQIVLKFASEVGFGESSYSAAVRLLIQHWSVLRRSLAGLEGEIRRQLPFGSYPVHGSVSPEDRLLETDGVDKELRVSDPEASFSQMPRIPRDEYEANWISYRLGNR